MNSLIIIEEYYRYKRTNTPKIFRRNLVDNMNPFQMPEQRFIDIYRLPQSIAMDLIDEIEGFFEQYPSQIPVHLQVLCALSFYASGRHQRQAGTHSFSYANRSTISKIICRTSKILTYKLGSKYVRFPKTSDGIQQAKANFFQKYRLPGILGLVEGTHIALSGLPKDKQGCAYINRKGWHSINVQLVCTERLVILNANARYPGSTNDSDVWENSLASAIMKEIHDREPVTWIVGNSGYALRPYMMVPKKNPINDEEKNYNIVLSKIRNRAKRCIRVLKGRFRCLHKERPLCYRHSKSALIVYSCVILHNYLIHKKFKVNADVEQYSNEEASFHLNNSENLSPEAKNQQFLVNYIKDKGITI